MQSATPFTLNISRYKEVQETKKTVVYYIIEVHEANGDTWKVEKRFKEFDNLNSVLKKVYTNLPSFPSKSLFALKGGEDIEKRRADLEQYMQGLVARSDLINSEVLKRFLEFDSATNDSSITPPKLVGEIPGLVMGVRDFYFQVDEGLLFVGLSDMSVTSRVDSYITNIKLPWGKESHKEGAAAVGSVECYKQIGSQSEFKFEKLWSKMFMTQVINIYWDQASCLFLVGKDDGTVTVLKVSSELNYIKYDEVVTNRLHQGRVMGVYIDSISEFVYSVGEDKKFKVYDLRKNDLVADITCGTALLTSIVPDKENKRAFISNRMGQVFIYDIGSVTPKFIHVIQAHPKGSIRGMYFDSYKNYLLTANYDDGYISMTDVQKPDRVKYSQVTTHLKGKKKVRCLVWCTSKAEVYAGGEDGSLSFWDVKRNFPVYILKAHSHGVTKLQHLSMNNVLVSGGKDGKLKFFKLPEEWSDKVLENVDLKEGEYVSPNGVSKITASILESNKQAKRALDDSDEDGEGWAQEF